MDELTFQQIHADKDKLKKLSSVLRSHETEESPSAPLKMIGKLEAVVEFNTRIAETLIGFQSSENLGLVLIAITVQTDKTSTNKLLFEEYDDLFKGIGKMEGIKVDLHIDHTVTPVSQPHRTIPFSIRTKLPEQRIGEAGS